MTRAQIAPVLRMSLRSANASVRRLALVTGQGPRVAYVLTREYWLLAGGDAALRAVRENFASPERCPRCNSRSLDDGERVTCSAFCGWEWAGGERAA